MGCLGRTAATKILPSLKKDDNINVVFANCDNIAGGRGATEATLKELLNCGVDFFTGGDHIFGIKSFENEIKNLQYIVRPANLTADSPGSEYFILDLGKLGQFLVVSLLGRTFIKANSECPFKKIDTILNAFSNKELAGVFVDFHAEATSEKVAMGHYLDGRVTAVFGTHTHIPTADQRILPQGTAYVTDVGMVGALNSVLGVKKDIIINNFISSMQRKFEWEEEGTAVFNSVLVDYDEKKRRVMGIERRDKEVIFNLKFSEGGEYK